mmetsp:Transcript_30999/g.72040  ORF Transcript_30999/g.72040 Transcript_30999/m.72040 type:complete len:95 (-) Transcript_30999:211-495(-)
MEEAVVETLEEVEAEWAATAAELMGVVQMESGMKTMTSAVSARHWTTHGWPAKAHSPSRGVGRSSSSSLSSRAFRACHVSSRGGSHAPSDPAPP